jgi:hypothetical protein
MANSTFNRLQRLFANIYRHTIIHKLFAISVRLQILTAASRKILGFIMKMNVFWLIATMTEVVHTSESQFTSTRLHGAISQNTATFSYLIRQQNRVACVLEIALLLRNILFDLPHSWSLLIIFPQENCIITISRFLKMLHIQYIQYIAVYAVLSAWLYSMNSEFHVASWFCCYNTSKCFS